MPSNCLVEYTSELKCLRPSRVLLLNFGDLNDVNVTSLLANRDYKLHYTGTEWKPAIDTINALGGWDLDIKLVHPYLSLGTAHAVKKIKNRGQLLATYVPVRKNTIIIENHLMHGYVLGTKGAHSGTLTLIGGIRFSSCCVRWHYFH